MHLQLLKALRLDKGQRAMTSKTGPVDVNIGLGQERFEYRQVARYYGPRERRMALKAAPVDVDCGFFQQSLHWLHVVSIANMSGV